MKVTSINGFIAERPGMKIINAGAVEGFFLIYYAPEDAEPPAKVTLTVYYNQAGREAFSIEE